ncbi:MAG: MATE family efflux transporter [Clostridia bacterium]|nr:MATE family efflux transporter [Clostridia bacterium]
MSDSTAPLTRGPIFKTLMKLALPIMASSFLSTAYSLTDMVWVGKLGAKAVAGIGVAGMYGWLSSGLSVLTRMGGQVHAAQCLGRGEKEEAGRYAAAAVQLVVLFGLVFGAVCLLFHRQLIAFYGLEDPQTIQYARSYLMITCGTVILPFLNTTLTGLYTAQGDAKTPLKANSAGLILNMILDPVLILGVGPMPRLEVVGAALATLTAHIVVTLVLIFSMKPEHLLRQTPLTRPVSGRYFSAVVRMGGPTALQSTTYCAISMVLTRLVAGFGDGAVAVQQIGGHIESLTWNTSDGFGSAMNAFAAQNCGAGKFSRIRRGYRYAGTFVFLWGTFIGLLFILFPTQICALFFREADVVALSVGYFVIVGISEPFMCLELMATGAISGLGYTRACSIVSIVLTALRIPMALGLTALGLGLNGIWWALTVSSTLKGVSLHVLFYRKCGKEDI